MFIGSSNNADIEIQDKPIQDNKIKPISSSRSKSISSSTLWVPFFRQFSGPVLIGDLGPPKKG